MSKKGNILIIDDHHANLESIEYTLGQNGYIVFRAYNLDQAQIILSHCRVDLLLFDHDLVDMDEMKSIKKFITYPVKMMFMSFKVPELVKMSIQEELDLNFLRKPFERDELLTIVNSLMINELTETDQYRQRVA